MRNKLLSILIITIYLFQSVSVQPVHAAPLLQAPDYSAVNFVKNINSAPDETGDLVYVRLDNAPVDTVVTTNNFGIGTPVANASVDVTTTCETSFCPSITVHVVVNNQDPVNERKLYTCSMVTQDDPAWDTWVLFTASTFDVLGFHLPYARCKTYTVPASTNVAVTLPIWTGSGTAGDPRVIHAVMAFSWAEVDTCGTPFVPTGGPVTKTIDVNTYDPVTQSQPDQIYDVTPGSYYKLNTDGYYSPDWQGVYTTDYIHISWDNVTWKNIELYDSKCFESEGDTTAWYLLAESDKLYVRVGDGTLGDTSFYGHPTPYGTSYLADDHVADGTTFSYVITEGVAPEIATCESQYTYDETNDLVGNLTVGVPGNNQNGVIATPTEKMVVGDWYIVKWLNGYWQDNGGSDQTSLEYSWYGSGSGYSDLAGGTGGGNGKPSGSVWCVSTSGFEILLQASAEDLYLRANNVIGTFTDNTGTANYGIYHVAFSRTQATCETNMQLGDLIEHKTVQADQANGLPFAQMVGGSIASIGLTPGAWYMLETTGGPWWQSVLSATPQYKYDMAVSEDGTSWGALEDWNKPSCNVPIDTLGHRRIIFQMPSAGEINWYLRVNATSFFINQGNMSWDLYGATPLKTNPGPNGCDYSYDETALIDSGTWSSATEAGITLNGLSSGSVFAIVIIPVGNGWKESVSGEYTNKVQISHNGGHQFYKLPEQYTAALCYETDISGAVQTLFVQPGDNYQYVLRADSTSFSNNWGDMSYQVYGATPGQSLVNTCFSGFSLQSINEFDWLDVRDEIGEVLAADTARYEEFVALVPGRSYAVETPAGQGPWTSESGGAGKYDVAISKDNGTTWYPVAMDTAILDCASQELIGHVWKAKFTVAEGDVWKLRVNDVAGTFADNGGNMAYKFYVLCDGLACTGSVPNDSVSNPIPAISIQGGGNVCNIAVMRPAALSVSELLNVGNYFGAWVQYINLSILRYMAWCPKHTQSLWQIIKSGLADKEPFATFKEWTEVTTRLKAELNSYDWSGGGDGFTLWNITNSTEMQNVINEKILPQTNSFWNGGGISFGQGTSLPAGFYSCSSALTVRLPASLTKGVCFVSAYFIETSASFWAQMALDIGVLFFIFGALKKFLGDVVFAITGVRIFTQKGREMGAEKLLDYYERRDREAEIQADMARHGRISHLTNKYWDYRKR